MAKTIKNSEVDSEIEWITESIPSSSGTLNIQKDDLENVYKPKKPTKSFLHNNNRHNKKVQFMKMLLTTRFTITPWSDVNECIEVHRNIYSSVNFITKELGDSEYSKHVEIMPNSIESLCFARDKLTIWKLRCRNLNRTQIIMSHLISIESILNVLIEESLKQSKPANESISHHSVLYSLYSMCVINFCNALSSYSSDLEFDMSILNLAQVFECPEWIVLCRHNLAHPSVNVPTISLLGEAMSFALEWMDRFFWSNAIKGEFTFNKPQKATAKKRLNVQMNYGNAKQDDAQIEERILLQTCRLLFTKCTNSNRFVFKRNIRQYMYADPNRYISMLVGILMYGSAIRQSLPKQSYKLPILLVRRSSRILNMIFTALPADQMLIVLLNQFIGQLEQCYSKECNGEYMENVIHYGLCWLWAIIRAVTISALNDTEETKRQTVFQKTFDLFGNFGTLKRRHTFTWIRMFYRISKLPPSPISSKLLKRFSYLIDQNVIPFKKIELIISMHEIVIESEEITIVDEVVKIDNVCTLKTVNDEDQFKLDYRNIPLGGSVRWSNPYEQIGNVVYRSLSQINQKDVNKSSIGDMSKELIIIE